MATPECGVTNVSLENSRRLREEHGRVIAIDMTRHRDSEKYGYVTTVDFEDGDQHEFTGFSWGYRGEGPHGLAQWAEEEGVGELNIDVIAELPNHPGAGTVWEWMR